MRPYGTNPTVGIPQPADVVNTLLLAAGTAQAMDWPQTTSSTIGSTGTLAIIRLTGFTTGSVGMAFQANLNSTRAATPSSGSSQGSSLGTNFGVVNQGTFQVPGGSTGFSIAALTSGYVMAEFWAK